MPLVNTKFRSMYLVSNKPDSSVPLSVNQKIHSSSPPSQLRIENENSEGNDNEFSPAVVAGPSVYSCSHCSEKFDEKEKLNNHVGSNHTNETSYDCKFCSYKTNKPDEFEKHVKSQHSTLLPPPLSPSSSSSSLSMSPPPSPTTSAPSSQLSTLNNNLISHTPPTIIDKSDRRRISGRRDLIMKSKSTANTRTPLYYPYPSHLPVQHQRVKRNIKTFDYEVPVPPPLALKHLKKKKVALKSLKHLKEVPRKKLKPYVGKVNSKKALTYEEDPQSNNTIQEQVNQVKRVSKKRGRGNVPNYVDEDESEEEVSKKKLKYNVGTKRKAFNQPSRISKRSRVATDGDTQDWFR